MSRKKYQGPKVLILDIETCPIVAHIFQTRDITVAPNQIVQDGFICSWAAKWYEDKRGVVYGPHNRLMHVDQRRRRKPKRNERFVMKPLWDIMNEADIILGQNSNSFDLKVINTGFFDTKLPKLGDHGKIDILLINRKNFSHTSNKLEFITKKYCKKYKKLNHGKFPGMELWNHVMLGEAKAWTEMEIYNKHDVLATEEYYQLVQGWDDSLNPNVWSGNEKIVCGQCGGKDFKKQGFFFKGGTGGKFQRFRCKGCGKPVTSKINLLSKEKRKSLRAGPQ